MPKALWGFIYRYASSRPAEVLVGGLLIGRHEVHELQAGTLVLCAQQRAAVGMNAAHTLQRTEEGFSYLAALSRQVCMRKPCPSFDRMFLLLSCSHDLPHLGTLLLGTCAKQTCPLS